MATLAGLISVLLWPLMLLGWMSDYPGERHARLMTECFFGGFVLGFLGTSAPRFLEVPPLRPLEVLLGLALLLASTATHTFGNVAWGDGLFLGAVAMWALALGTRWRRRADLPPPGFVMIPLAFASLVTGLAMLHRAAGAEAPELELTGRLLSHHAFVLLCILGAGGFLLPRFLGLGVRESFPGSRTPDTLWARSAALSALTAGVVIGSYALDVKERPQFGSVIRAAAIVFHFVRLMPLERLRFHWRGVQWLLITGLAMIPAGIVATGWLGGWRVALAHLELVGGFGLITFGVATRVLMGHSGTRERLEKFHRSLTIAGGLMLLGMATRISGDFLPDIMVSHYIYGALCWAAGVILWAAVTIPLVLRPDPDAD